MAYNEFAYFYDEFNGEADYDALYAHIHATLEEQGIHDGILSNPNGSNSHRVLYTYPYNVGFPPASPIGSCWVYCPVSGL